MRRWLRSSDSKALISEIALRDTSAQPEHASVSDPARDLNVVRVVDVERRLQDGAPAHAILAELMAKEKLLSRASTAAARVALVSYRQEPGVPATRCHERRAGQPLSGLLYDAFTMDGVALLGVLDAAKRLGVDALWLDTWCYCFEGEYDHEHFCRTLHDVVSSVVAVVWLPRAKVGCKGEYGYRLWCTFEASAVQQRGLPVAIAGQGLSSMQSRVLLLGRFAPALRADGTLDGLCRINLCFFVACVAELCIWLLRWREQVPVAFGMLSRTCVLPLSWMFFVSVSGQQLRLASNAHRVLRIMTQAARGQMAGCTCWSLVDGLWPVGRRRIQDLVADLAWLPAFDRRDGLVVQELLRRLSATPLEMGAASRNALAWSCYTAARQLPSPGDESAQRLPLSAWLAERGITLEATGQSGAPSTQQQTAAGPQASPEGSAWLSGRASTAWLSGRASTAADDASSAASIPLSTLQKFGWIWLPGLTVYALMSPVGVMVVPPPEQGRWLVGEHVIVTTPRLQFTNSGTAYYLCTYMMIPVFEGIKTLESRFEGLPYANLVRIVIQIALTSWWFGSVICRDVRLHKGRRTLWPMPFHAADNWLSMTVSAAGWLGVTALVALRVWREASDELPANLQSSNQLGVVLSIANIVSLSMFMVWGCYLIAGLVSVPMALLYDPNRRTALGGVLG